jgi:methylase of polypeptide subunit release factors
VKRDAENAQSGAPLLFRLELTADQQRRISNETGLTLTALHFESRAQSLRVRFGGVTLDVPRGVFVPSALTERVLALAVGVAAKFSEPVLVDVGTGCGALALAAAHALPAATLYATDIAEIALRSARRNRARLGMRNVRFLQGSLLAPLSRRLRGNVAVIAANVPYVPPRLSDAFAGSFPVNSAIGVGEDGLGLVRDVAGAARDFLVPGGALVLQLADFQWDNFSRELDALGYRDPEVSERGARGPIACRLTWPGPPFHGDRRMNHDGFTINR